MDFNELLWEGSADETIYASILVCFFIRQSVALMLIGGRRHGWTNALEAHHTGIRPARSKSQKEHKSRVNETPYFGAKPEVVYELGEKVQKVR